MLNAPTRTPVDRDAVLASLSRRLDSEPVLGLDPRNLRAARRKWCRIATLTAGRALKRLLDIAVSASLLALASPLFLLVGLCIKLTDSGPVLYWQTRVGRFGRAFRFPKFRSMVLNAEQALGGLLDQNQHRHESGVTFKMKRDPRVTWIGRIIRRLSIDELPQLWNVLRGDMTLVGPRPPVPREVSQYTLADRRRLDVVPGLTCLWQVSGRSEIPFPGQVELDVQYIETHSLLLDLKLLLRTIPAVLLGRGAY